MKKNNKGFSLVELIVVIAIMAILAAVAIPTFATFINKANEGADEDFMNQAAYAIELANAGTYGFELTSVAVTKANNEITKISYEYKVGDEEKSAEVASNLDLDASTTTQIQKDIFGAIDWDYSFKAFKDNTTVTLTTSDNKVVGSN